MDAKLISIIAAAIAVAVGSIGPALAEGRSVAAAMDAIARQPEAAGTISRTLFVGLAMIETMAIYCLVIALLLLFANPYAGVIMQLDWSTLALQTVNFGVLVWLLHRFLYQPVLRMIEARKLQIRAEADDAKALTDQARVQLAAVEKQRAGIAAEREAALKAAAAQAQQAAQAQRARAESDAQALLQATRQTLASEREQALREARRLAVDLGAQFARQLLTDVPQHLLAQSWLERIENYLLALPKTELDGLAAQLRGKEVLRVVTASALAPATSELWRERLSHTLQGGGACSFQVDPALVAGADLHFPTAVLHFSWQAALAGLRSQVDAHADTQ